MSLDGTEPKLVAAFMRCQLISVGIIPSTLLLFRTTSLHCGVIIHVSLCRCSPGSEVKGLKVLFLLCLLPRLCLFSSEGALEGYSTKRGVAHSSRFKNRPCMVCRFLRHHRRILASASPHTPSCHQSTDKPDFTACTANTAWNHSYLWQPHHSLVT